MGGLPLPPPPVPPLLPPLAFHACGLNGGVVAPKPPNPIGRLIPESADNPTANHPVKVRCTPEVTAAVVAPPILNPRLDTIVGAVKGPSNPNEMTVKATTTAIFTIMFEKNFLIPPNNFFKNKPSGSRTLIGSFAQ
jgi:hypothetical protein